MIYLSRQDKTTKKTWKLSLPGKAIALLIIMAVHSTQYPWWMYALVVFVGGRLDWEK